MMTQIDYAPIFKTMNNFETIPADRQRILIGSPQSAILSVLLDRLLTAWTYIKDELPETGEYFLVSYEDKDGDLFTAGAYHYDENEWYQYLDNETTPEPLQGDVYAWQEWPRPAKRKD